MSKLKYYGDEMLHGKLHGIVILIISMFNFVGHSVVLASQYRSILQMTLNNLVMLKHFRL